MRSHRPLLCALLCAAAAVGGVEGRCRAVIIAAGAPRTGSTQQLKLVKIALDNMGLTDNVVDAGYWRYQRHVRGNESTLAEEERETAKLQAGWTEHTIVLYKSHEFDAELLSLCSQALVVLTHSSCLESTARSAVLANFIPLDQDALHGHVDIVYRDLAAWRQLATLDLAQDDLRYAPMHSLMLTYHLLAARLGIPFAHKDFSRHRAEVLSESNPNIPHKAASPELRAKLHTMMLRVRERYQNDERLRNVRWVCPPD